MLADVQPDGAILHRTDICAFLRAQSVADAVNDRDVVEYWKSAPYLFNFMDNYALKRSFKDAPEKDTLIKTRKIKRVPSAPASGGKD
jgi:hypothetical protein